MYMHVHVHILHCALHDSVQTEACHIYNVTKVPCILALCEKVLQPSLEMTSHQRCVRLALSPTISVHKLALVYTHILTKTHTHNTHCK